MNFLQWAVWGAYLTSMGNYLADVGLGGRIGIFYAVQGIVSMFMPAILGAVADKFMSAEKLLGICHGIAGAALIGAGYYGMTAGANVDFGILFTLYTLSVSFYMPSIALSNSVAFKVLEKNGFDTVKDFPPVRVFGTVGFIAAMLFVNFVKDGSGVQFMNTYNQFFVSGVLGLVMLVYCFTLPNCPATDRSGKISFAEIFGVKAFKLFKNREMATFFIFAMLLGVALQITNSFANPYIAQFKIQPEFADSWGAQNGTALYSISQMSETLGILLIPVALKFFGIKKVMLIAMFAWVLRFGLLGLGDPGSGVWMFILSMIVYGVAFDFFNISGALYTNARTSENIQSSAQGLFMLMTNGIGATVGALVSQQVINHFTHPTVGIDPVSMQEATYMVGDWSTCWYIFAAYALVIAIAFIFAFKDPGNGKLTKIA